jgi:4-hydroxybenzoate polyprenyltransferase
LFGLCASSVYLLNDLLDLEDDRHHTTKRHRPFAAGTLSVKTGLFVFPALLIAAFSGALWLLPWQFTATLTAYYVLTISYSLLLKRLMIIDVVTLAMLYTLRIVAGAFALSLVLTFWMLAFSMFMFLSLALIKRYAELREARHQGKTEKSRGRGYYPDDLEMIASLGAASGYLSVLVLALYIHDYRTTDLYRYPEVVWLACPLLLFWISRTWLLTHRGQMHDDPVVFAIKDRFSLGIAGLFGIIFWMAA